jgi:hypothetical protein
MKLFTQCKHNGVIMTANGGVERSFLLSVGAVNIFDTYMSVYKIVVLRDKWVLLIAIERWDSVTNSELSS